MGDYRAELQALIAACEDHCKWMLADKFDALRQAVQRARAALDGSAVPESWHIPRALSDETLRLLTELPEDEIRRRLRMEPAAVEGQPSDQEVAKLVKTLKGIAFWRRRVDIRQADRLDRAAALLEQLSASHPLRPIPVSERLPGPGDCDAQGRCWWGDGGDDQFVPSWRLCEQPDDTHFDYWLPTNALPLPEENHD